MMALFMAIFAGLFLASSAVYQCTPSAHLEGGDPRTVEYPNDQAIKAWDPKDTNSYLSDGFVYNPTSGKLRVPATGRYYVYFQMYFNNRVETINKNRLILRTANRDCLMIHVDLASGMDKTVSTGGVFQLQEEDEIYVVPVGYTGVKMWVGPLHSFFGLYLI